METQILQNEIAPVKAETPSVPQSRYPQMKILYLGLVAISVLTVRNPIFCVSLLGFQLVLWTLAGFHRKDLRILKNSLPFALSILVINSIFDTPRDFALFAVGEHELFVSSHGFFDGLLMGVRLYAILCASAVIRVTTSSDDFIKGLVQLKVSKNFAMVLDSILHSMEGKNRGSGKGKGQGREKNQKVFRLKSILKGDLGFLVEMFDRRLAEAKEKFADHDWAVISAVSVIVVALRLVKILPGIPFAPGYKNAIFIPIFIVTSRLTKMRFAATYVGLISGVVNFMFGYGKYGVLGIMQFAVPGLIVDLMDRLNKNSFSVFWFAFVGFCAGFARVSVETLLAFAFGLPAEFYLLYSPYILTQCSFGALSAPVSTYLLKNLKPELFPERQGL